MSESQFYSYTPIHVFDVNIDLVTKASTIKIEDDYRLVLQLGYRQNPHFTGREVILNALHIALTTSMAGVGRESPTAVVLLGIGGVGKTQLARQYAYRYSSNHTSISWINGMSIETIYASFLELAQRIIPHYVSRNKAAIPPFSNLAQHLGMHNLIDIDGQIIFTHKTRQPIVEAIKTWFSLHGNNGWLMIFDNVDDLDSFSIGDFFPATAENGRILITTRRRECTRFGDELELDVLEERESINLLQRSCQYKQPFKDKGMFTIQPRGHPCSHICEYQLMDGAELDDARALVRKLGHLPLAIDQAGAYLHTMRKPLVSYLPLLQPNKIKATLSRKPPSAVWSYEESVFTTWEVSFLEIQKRNPASAEILTICSFFSNVELQQEMLERGFKVAGPEGMILNLLNQSNANIGFLISSGGR